MNLVIAEEECAKYRNFTNFFNLQFSSRFKCLCKEETVLETTKFSFKVRISDWKEVRKLSLFDIYEKNLREKEFKLCKNPNCSYKKSKLTEKMMSSSEYIILEIDNNSERFEVNESNISVEMEFKKIDNKFIDVYEIFLISASDKDHHHILFRRHEDYWLDERSSDFDLQNVLYLINSSNFQINLILYKLKTQSFDTSSSVSVGNNASRVKCDYCRSLNHKSSLLCENCRTKLKNLCSTCNTTYEITLKSCPNCEKLKRNSNPLTNPCPGCKSLLINGRNCTKCYQKSTPIKVVHLNTEISNQATGSNQKSKCITCRKSYSATYSECPSCKIPEEEKPKVPSKQKLCETCNKPKDSIICTYCSLKSPSNFYLSYNPTNYSSPLPKSSIESQSELRKSQLTRPDSSAKPKRGASASVCKVYCSNCSSGLNSTEQRNCGNCYKTMSSKSDKCSYCFKPIISICSCCLSNKKKK